MTIALVPARAGSKGVVDKNFKPFAGSSLVEITLKQAAELVGSRNVFLSSDHPSAQGLASKTCVNFIPRPSHLCTDSSDAVQVVNHAIEVIESSIGPIDQGELVLYLQPTSPLRDIELIRKTLLDPKSSNGFVSLRRARETPYKQLVIDNQGFSRGVMMDERLASKNRQELPTTYVPNGNVFALKRSVLPAEVFPIFGLAAIVETEGESDIDNYQQFENAERQYLRQHFSSRG